MDNKTDRLSVTVNIYYTLCHPSSMFVCQQSAASFIQGVTRCDRVLGMEFFLLNSRMFQFSWQHQVLTGICWFTFVEALQCHRVDLLLLLLLLAGTLLFFLPHPLPQLLTNISQRVHFGREGLYCIAKPAGLWFQEFAFLWLFHLTEICWLRSLHRPAGRRQDMFTCKTTT